MQFVEPVFLWGTLAIAIPIAIHFWHQKRGKILPWAATQWLTERDQQPSRGLRLDNILLLLVRCLLLVLLAILLAQPILNGLQQSEPLKKIHLVQSNALVTDNFRFELDEARRKDETIWWADVPLRPVDEKPDAEQTQTELNPLRLQTAIDRANAPNIELHLYLVNDPALADVPIILMPPRFRLHTVVDSANRPRPYLTGRNNKKLFINQRGKLISGPTLDPTLKFQSEPAHSGPIRVWLDYRNSRERQTVRAALGTLSDVYGFDLTIDDSSAANRPYDWIFTNRIPAKPNPPTLYIVSGTTRLPTADQIVFTPDVLTPQTSERVENGQLPEWIGERLLRHYGLETNRQPLSQRALNALFVATTEPEKPRQAGLQNALLLLFVILIILERWLALTKST